jgi:type IX secretion system PorP/SprF family membrane protein
MIDPQSVSITSQTAELRPNSLNRSYFDIGSGVLVYSKKVFFGIAVKHLTQPTISFYEAGKSLLPIRFAANLGYEFKKKKKSKNYFAPNILYVQQGRFQQINIGGYLGTGALTLGLALRHNFTNADALILSAGIKKGVFKTAYSYDPTISNLRGKSGGAHELSLAFNLGDSKKAERKRNLKRFTECPSIF